MTIVDIRSPHNPLIRTVRLVASRSRQAPRELVLAEGPRVLEEALASRHRVSAAILEGAFGKTARERSLLENLGSSGVRTYRTSARLLRSIGDVIEPQGILALVEVAPTGISDVTLPAQAVVVCACGIRDPGNLGTLIRTAAAAGVALFCSTPDTVSARNPKTVRASAGAFFRSNVVEAVSPGDFLQFCRRHGLSVFRADASRGVEYSCADLAKPFALLLGNEAHGFCGTEWGGVPALRIPIAEGVESLNVGTAGAVILFEALRQRRTPGRDPGKSDG